MWASADDVLSLTRITAVAYKRSAGILGTESTRAYNRILRLLLVLINGIKCHWLGFTLNGSARMTYAFKRIVLISDVLISGGYCTKCMRFNNYNHGIKQLKDEELFRVWKELLAV